MNGHDRPGHEHLAGETLTRRSVITRAGIAGASAMAVGALDSAVYDVRSGRVSLV